MTRPLPECPAVFTIGCMQLCLNYMYPLEEANAYRHGRTRAEELSVCSSGQVAIPNK